MKKDLVSIIVPIYGTEDYLSSCIDSLLKQTYTNIQIILIDDKSPDRCPEICDYYAKKDERIKVVHQENKGVSGARNTGLRHSTGDYIVFVDSDDELEPKAVEILLNDAKQYNADIVSAKAKVVDKNGNTISECNDNNYTLFDGDKPLLLSLNGCQISEAVWAKIFKTSFIRDIYFEEGKNIHEDGFFLFQCFNKKPILLQHNISVYQYNIREDSCSRQLFSDKYMSIIDFLNRKKEIIIDIYPQYVCQCYNMEVRTNLQLLDLLCSTKEKKYMKLQSECIKNVCELNKYHNPINRHHKQLAWIVTHGLFPLYKWAVRVKHYR